MRSYSFKVLVFTSLAISGIVGIASASTTIGTSINTAGTLTVSGTATSSFIGALSIGTSTPLGGGLLTVGTTSPFYIDQSSGTVGIGTTSPRLATNVDIENNPANSTWSNLLIGSNSVFNNTTNGSYFTRGIDMSTYNSIASGVTNSGNIMGINNSIYRNTSFAGDTGTLGTMYGYYSEFGHFAKDASTPTTGTVYGMYLYPNARTGTITNFYDLYIQTMVTGGTVSNRWSIYQQDTASRNYFGGKVGIGTTTPTTQLQATASASNATSTVTIGKVGQNKGSCLELYDSAGTAVYAYVAAGASTFTLSAVSCK